MELKTLKALALTSAIVFGLAMAGPAHAQTETLTTTLTTSSAITTTVAQQPQFGTYLIQIAGGDTPTMTMSTDGTDTITVAGVVDAQTQIIFVSGTPQEGDVNVQIPAAGTLQMTNNVAGFSNFADAGLSLTRVNWATVTENGNFDPGVAGVAQPITILAGATDELVRFGPRITASITPADATHTADFQVDFAY